MSTGQRSEKEKMLSGEMYNAFTPELYSERLRCKELVYDFNTTRPTETEKRQELLKKLCGSFGENSTIEAPIQFDYVILDTCPVHVGDYVLMGPDVKIYAATHPTDPQSRLDGLEYGKSIRIGNNVWIGGGTIIVAGVTIGDNSVIGAGSVVVKDIPANVVAVGNPCKVIKQLEAPVRPPNDVQLLNPL